jgi:hypothetical protein
MQMSTRKKAAKPASTKTPRAKPSKAKATLAADAGNAAKPAAEKAPKKPSQVDAAAKVLSESEEPMNAKAMVEAMVAKGYWTPGIGKTPEATLYSAIIREISKKGRDARFKKVERGQFTLSARK